MLRNCSGNPVDSKDGRWRWECNEEVDGRGFISVEAKVGEGHSAGIPCFPPEGWGGDTVPLWKYEHQKKEMSDGHTF